MLYGGYALVLVALSPVQSQPASGLQPGKVDQADVEIETATPTGFSLTLGNDYFAVAQERNDRGITSDIEASVQWKYGRSEYRSGVAHTVFREDRRGSMLRWDVGRLFLSSETSLPPWYGVLFSVSTHAEGTYRGDLKGDDMQDFVHQLPGVHGDTLGNGLHDQYPQRARQGIAFGVGGTAQLNLPTGTEILHGALRIVGTGQLAPLDTGLTRLAASAETRSELAPVEGMRLAVGARVTVGHVSSRDPALRLRGAYNNARGPIWGPTVESALKIRTGNGEYDWTSVFLRVTPSFDGTGTRGGSGAMGWVGVEVGSRPWFP